jgi:drug/metabolite transporter, DME family
MSVHLPGLVAARRSSGLFCLVAAGLLWGTGGLTGTVLGRVAGLSPMAVAAFRLTAGGALIMVFLIAAGRHRRPAGRAAWTRVALVGLLAAQFQCCYFCAVWLTSVSMATLVTIGSAPVIVQAASRLLGRPTAVRPATTVLALAGLALLVGLPGSGFRESAMLAGAGLAVAAAGGFATLTLLGGVTVDGLDELTAVGYGFTAGGTTLLVVAALTTGVAFTPRPAAIGLLIALGIGPTALAYTLYFRGLRTMTASAGALLSLLEPLTGTILAVLLLGNQLDLAGIAGAVMLAAAVALTARHSGRGLLGGADHGGGAPRPPRSSDAQPATAASAAATAKTTVRP